MQMKKSILIIICLLLGIGCLVVWSFSETAKQEAKTDFSASEVVATNVDLTDAFRGIDATNDATNGITQDLFEDEFVWYNENLAHCHIIAQDTCSGTRATIHLLLTDPWGRHDGVDPIKGKEYFELSLSSSYDEEIVGEDDISDDEECNPSKIMGVCIAPDLEYTLQVIGIGDEPYRLFFCVQRPEKVRQPKERQIEVGFENIAIKKDEIHTYKMKYGSNSMLEVRDVTDSAHPKIKRDYFEQ